jgi:DNA-binding NarL/FixJ family response regulator
MGSCGYVLVVDDDPAYREMLIELLERIDVTARAVTDGQQALACAREERPALVLLDVRLPGLSGYEVCRELRDMLGDDLRIVFLSGERTEAYDRVAGLLIGGDDYVVKPFDPDELLARVRAQLRHVGVTSDGSGNGTRPDAASELTARERQVLDLLARGLTQAEIAEHLVISPKTVGTHIQHVLTKLGVHNRTQAVALAHRLGLVDADVEVHGLLQLEAL